MIKRIAVVSTIIMSLCGINAAQAGQNTELGKDEKSMGIQDNNTVQLEYSLVVDGDVVDSNKGGEPFSYIHGQRQIVPGLERQLVGLQVGEEREITVTPEEGYGAIDSAAFINIPKEQLAADVEPEVGALLEGTDNNGRPFSARISEIQEATVTLDLNHPLAGKTLLFKVSVLEISETS